MENEVDVFDFVLAESLHMSVAEVRNLSNLEYVQWRAFYVYRNAMQDFERSKNEGTRR